MVKFYTLPPIEIPYPFILINSNNPSLEYVIKHKNFIESIIIDSGVEIFRDPNTKDYPPHHLEKIVNLYKLIKNMLRNVQIYVTIPDYPDDYHPKSLWVGNKTNIERTLDNILYALESYNEVNWLIPVQGHYKSPKSIIYALELYQKHDIKLDDYIAIANLCVEERVKIINKTVKLAHKWLWSNGYYYTKIHVFGSDIRSIYHLKNIIYSFDSMGWTRPRVAHGWSAKTSMERVYLFITWIYRYANVIEIPLLPKTMRKKFLKY